jgi:Ser/Thr protein kinase RdoA (MazF antagonist)
VNLPLAYVQRKLRKLRGIDGTKRKRERLRTPERVCASESDCAQQRFLEKIQDYWEAVLAPSGIGREGFVLIEGYNLPKVCLYADATRVVKFYSSNNRTWARNSAAVMERLHEAGVSVPRVLRADVDDVSIRRHGVACIVMDRIQGDTPRIEEISDDAVGLARQLARMHRIRGERWGGLHPGRKGDAPEIWMRREVLPRLKRVRRSLDRMAHPPFEQATEWFREQWRELAGESGTFELTWYDFHDANMRRSDSGNLYLIDFDQSGYRCFGLDVAQILLRVSHGVTSQAWPGDGEGLIAAIEHEGRGFLTNYFKAMPEAFRKRWESVRRVCLAFAVLRYYANLLESAEWSGWGLDAEGAAAEALRARCMLDLLMDGSSSQERVVVRDQAEIRTCLLEVC